MSTLKKFIKYYGPYKTILLLDLICAAVVSLVDLAYPQILRYLTSTLFTEEADAIRRALPIIGLLLVVAYIIQCGCNYFITCQGHIMGAKMERDMRKELFDQYERLSFSYYDKNNTGQLMSRLVSDLFDISELAHHGPENLFISTIKIVGSFVMLFMIQAKLALILLCVVLFMVLFSGRVNRWMNATFMDNRRKVGNINETLQDSLSGIRTVQAFTNEKIEEQKFKKGNERFLISKRENYHAMGIFHAGNLFLQGMLYCVTVVFGGYFIARGEMTPADMMMYALYIGVFVSPIKVLVELTEMLQKGMSGFKRFLEIVEIEPEIYDDSSAEELAEPFGAIRYHDVSFYYDEENPVLDHISIDIEPGRYVALVGPSGAGKTTICNLLPRFYNLTGGSITIGGQDIRHVTLESLRHAIGIVQQDVYLFGGSIKENIEYGKPGAAMEEIIAAAKKANIHDFIMSLPHGYDTYVGERGVLLSGGQKQRISIARVFLKNPPILILDEATSALDNESERYIQKSLEDLALGRTTITIAHRISTIMNADEILVIDEQEIKERGTHDELIAADGIYAKYYKLSSKTDL